MATDTDALSETASHTGGCKFVKICATPGWHNSSVSYSHQYQVLVSLRDRLETDGSFYTKSRSIAEEIEPSSREVGAAMRELREEQVPVEIEKWGYTNGTTWRIWES